MPAPAHRKLNSSPKNLSQMTYKSPPAPLTNRNIAFPQTFDPRQLNHLRDYGIMVLDSMGVVFERMHYHSYVNSFVRGMDMNLNVNILYLMAPPCIMALLMILAI